VRQGWAGQGRAQAYGTRTHTPNKFEAHWTEGLDRIFFFLKSCVACVVCVCSWRVLNCSATRLVLDSSNVVCTSKHLMNRYLGVCTVLLAEPARLFFFVLINDH
jgi:hypothetical protein